MHSLSQWDEIPEGQHLNIHKKLYFLSTQRTLALPKGHDTQRTGPNSNRTILFVPDPFSAVWWRF